MWEIQNYFWPYSNKKIHFGKPIHTRYIVQLFIIGHILLFKKDSN